MIYDWCTGSLLICRSAVDASLGDVWAAQGGMLALGDGYGCVWPPMAWSEDRVVAEAKAVCEANCGSSLRGGSTSAVMRE